jgi:transposase
MEEGDGTGIFTDETWAIWEPLIGAVRPKGETPLHDLRRMIAAIFWRHENGAKWRRIPAVLGPWWWAAQLFIRWARRGVWKRMLERVQAQRGVALGMTFLDGTNIRAHHKAAGAQKKGPVSKNQTIVKYLAALAAAMAQKSA